jgi:hypothetical protein
MSERETAIAKPPVDAFLLFDRADDSAVIARIQGQALKECVYAFKQAGQMIYGLSVDGADECKRELARSGEVIREDEITILREDPERAYFVARASRWAIAPDKSPIQLDTKIETKNQAKFTTRRDGSVEPNPFWFEQGASKAMRNAVLGLVPAVIKQRVIALYQGSAKVVEASPEVGDAMAHEYHAAFKEKDEHAALVKQLKERWTDLGLLQMQVKAILAKRGLPESLAARTADWSSVDIAAIRDLLAEASV